MLLCKWPLLGFAEPVFNALERRASLTRLLFLCPHHLQPSPVTLKQT